MPVYKFSVYVGAEEAIRSVEHVAADPDAAWVMARGTIESLLAEAAAPALLRAVLVVTDADGEIVFELPFAEAIVPDDAATRH